MMDGSPLSLLTLSVSAFGEGVSANFIEQVILLGSWWKKEGRRDHIRTFLDRNSLIFDTACPLAWINSIIPLEGVAVGLSIRRVEKVLSSLRKTNTVHAAFLP